MRPKRIAPGLMLVVALAIPGAASADVRVDWDRAVTHARFGSFSWGEGTPLTNPLAEIKIRRAVTAALRGRGLKEKGEGADLRVILHSSLAPDQPMRDEGYRRHPQNWKTPVPDLDRIDAGTLVVDLVDAATDLLVWRAVATGTVTNNPSRNEKKVPRAVGRMFRRYPPPPPKTED